MRAQINGINSLIDLHINFTEIKKVMKEGSPQPSTKWNTDFYHEFSKTKINTTLAENAILGETIISVNDATGMVLHDKIQIYLDPNILGKPTKSNILNGHILTHYTSIVSIFGNNIRIKDPLIFAASSDNKVMRTRGCICGNHNDIITVPDELQQYACILDDKKDQKFYQGDGITTQFSFSREENFVNESIRVLRFSMKEGRKFNVVNITANCSISDNINNTITVTYNGNVINSNQYITIQKLDTEINWIISKGYLKLVS